MTFLAGIGAQRLDALGGVVGLAILAKLRNKASVVFINALHIWFWYARRELNPQPLAPEANALSS